jgi:hypothetical protein
MFIKPPGGFKGINTVIFLMKYQKKTMRYFIFFYSVQVTFCCNLLPLSQAMALEKLSEISPKISMMSFVEKTRMGTKEHLNYVKKNSHINNVFTK